MHSCLPASMMTPATLALMTEVGPPDWATNKFPTNSAIIFVVSRCARRGATVVRSPGRRPQCPQTLPTGPLAVKGELACHCRFGRCISPSVEGRLVRRAEASPEEIACPKDGPELLPADPGRLGSPSTQ